MNGYNNTEPRPYANLASPYVVRELAGGLNQLDTSVFVGPILFLSPTKVRIFIRGTNVKKSFFVEYSELYANLTINTADGATLVTTNYSKYVSNDDFDSTFSGTFETQSPITSIYCNDVRVYIDGAGASSNPHISSVFDKTIPVVQATQPYIVTGNQGMTHILLPQNPITGQWFRIKSGINALTYIHTLGIPVDNPTLSATSYVSNQRYMQMNAAIDIPNQPYTSYTAYGFTMESMDSCMIIYNGTCWIIQEYRNGGLNAEYNSIFFTPTPYLIYISWATINPAPSNIIQLTASSPEVTITDISTGSKIVQLPDPASYIGMKYLIGKKGASTNTLSIRGPTDSSGNYLLEDGNEIAFGGMFFFINTGTTFGQKKGNVLTFNGATGPQIAITLMSDGRKWWVMNTYIGQYTTINSGAASGVPFSIENIVSCISTPTYSGVTLPRITDISGGATPRYIKLLRTGNSTGITASAIAGSVIGGTPGITSTVFNSNYKDNTALSFIAYQPLSGDTEYYITGSFIGY